MLFYYPKKKIYSLETKISLDSPLSLWYRRDRVVPFFYLELVMKISNNTISLLKNFSAINNSIFIKSGREIWTTSADKSIIGYCTVEESFPVDFGIYDLNRFLSLVSFFENPDFEFTNDEVKILSSKSRTNYRFADPRIIAHRNEFEKVEKYIRQSSSQLVYPIQFNLTDADLQDFLKKSSVLKLGDVLICTENGVVTLQSHDKKNDLSDKHVLYLDDKIEGTFSAYISVDKFKIISGDYTVHVGESVINFKNNKHDVQYWIAPDSDTQIKV